MFLRVIILSLVSAGVCQWSLLLLNDRKQQLLDLVPIEELSCDLGSHYEFLDDWQHVFEEFASFTAANFSYFSLEV